MFEDRTYDNLMNEMLSNFPDDVRTDEGSLVFNAMAKQALQLEEAYMWLSYLYDNLLVSTMTEDILKQYGAERGVVYQDATNCIVRGVFARKVGSEDLDIPMGSIFYNSLYQYEVIKKIDNNYFELKCLTPGTLPNTLVKKEITPVDYIDNLDTAWIDIVLVAGSQAEDIEHYRKRVIDSFNPSAFAGNRKAYQEKIKTIKGVGGCKCKRRTGTNAFIDITVISAGYTKPSDELIAEIQNIIDPGQDGEGDGFCPICHRVNIKPVGELQTNFIITLSVTDDIKTEEDLANLNEKITAQVDYYINNFNKGWEESGDNKRPMNPTTDVGYYVKQVQGVEVLDNIKMEIEGKTYGETVFIDPSVIFARKAITLKIISYVPAT